MITPTNSPPVLVIMYVRYKHLHRDYQEMKWVSRFNTAAFGLGILSVLGMLLVASFQVRGHHEQWD